MASRSINLANEVADRKSVSSIMPIATLENPPESNVEQHLSAWELPEMEEFTKRANRRTALFNTCNYQKDREIGKRHFKPQKFVGTLMGIESLSRQRDCGQFAKHDPITGPEKSKDSAQ